MTKLSRSKDNPWNLMTPPQASSYSIYTAEKEGKPVLVVTVGRVTLVYDARCVDDAHKMLKQRGDWMELGGADENDTPRPGTFEAWGRDPKNPVSGWYGLKPGLRGRFAVYIPPLLEALGLCELEHKPKHNRIRAKVAAHKKSQKTAAPL